MQMWENIAGAKRYFRPRGFNIAGASAPVALAIPTPLSSDRNVRRWQCAVFRPVSFCMLYNRINVMKGGTQTDGHQTDAIH